MIDVLELRAITHPHKLAYRYMNDRGHETEQLTYLALRDRARSIALELIRNSLPGETALLVFPQGLEFIAAFFACLYAGVIAVPVIPPKRNRPSERYDLILNETGARLALVQEPEHAAWIAEVLTIIATRPIATESAAQWTGRELKSSDIAFLQFTSGSTAAPKGVVLTHGNILDNQRMIEAAFEHSEETVVVGWLPHFHDMGLIGNVIQPVYVGGSCIQMSPTSFLLKPVRWLQAISRYRATTSGAPNFAYELCLRKVVPQQDLQLDLSSWTLAFNGAERVRHSTMERFADTFAGWGFRREAFYPCYGLAESTLLVAGGSKSDGYRKVSVPQTGSVVVGCGWSRLQQRFRIVDPEALVACDEGVEGEIWLSGPCVAQGYWRRPEATREVFQAFLQSGDGPYLRTGDLGYVLGGELFISGRIKDLIIIRGDNHHPEDIEANVDQCHSALKPGSGVAFSVIVDDEEQLVLAYEIGRDVPPGDYAGISDSIREAVVRGSGVNAHGVVLLKPGAIPRTSSGKVRRSQCRDAYLEHSLEIVQTDTEG